MHDIKFIKNNSNRFDKSLEKRNLKPCSVDLIKIYEDFLKNLKKKQNLQEKRNKISKKFSSEKNKENIEKLKKEVSDLKDEMNILSELAEKKSLKLNDLLLEIPNILDEKTPLGTSEDENKVLKECGEKKKFTFEPKNHVELAENLRLIDYDQASKISGSRFSVLKSDLALLHRALMNFMLDINIEEYNYLEYKVPELVKSHCLVGTGQLPKFSDDLFQTTHNDLWLIPTSEVPLTNLHREQLINLNDLPLRYTTYTNCFRSEAGASGLDTKGLMREHQFGKVELVSITFPNDSMSELERMVKCVEKILEKLELPYRLVELCSADVGFSSSYTIDLEIWMPGQEKYREVSSCSNCKDFQSRRMKMRVKNFDSGEIFFPHTLNGSSLAIGRIIVGILENFQQSDGSIIIPKALRGYMRGLEKLSLNEKKK